MEVGTLFPGTISAGRMEDMSPHNFRMAQYPDGSKRIQGAYQWSQGQMWGVTWKDLPLVYVNNLGEELKYANGMVR